MSGRLQVCLGFDGSDSEDWTAIRAETRDGWQFTPRYGPDRRPTIWNPADWGGEIPRSEVDVALGELFGKLQVARLYCDPYGYQSEIDTWAGRYGSDRVYVWDTGRGTARVPAVHAALQRFVTDLKTGRLTHDGCEITAVHVANARKAAKSGDRYVLAKPAGQVHRKIDAAMASVLAHEAAADAHTATAEKVAGGWTPLPPKGPRISRNAYSWG